MGEIIERTIPGKALTWTGERLTSDVGGQVEIEHLHRYLLARDHCRGLDVLDVASGEGYGAALLAQVARSATGVEISVEAVEHAAQEYRRPNLRFLQGDARKLPLSDQSIDVVVSFETVEHMYEHDVFLAEIRRVLRPGGKLVMSSPNSEVYSPPGSEANQYHVRELSRTEFADLIGRHFAHWQLLGQRPMVGSVLLADGDASAGVVTIERRGGSRFERTDGLPQAVYFVAIASDNPLSPAANSVFVESSEVGPLLGRAASFEPTRDALRETVHRAEAAEAAFHASREEIAKCMREASEEREAAREEIARCLSEASREREAAAALLAERAAVLPTVPPAVLAELEAARLTAEQASRERDIARAALRRAAVHSGLDWKARLVGLLDQLAQAEEREAELTAKLMLAQEDAALWCDRYHRLRGRLERLLRRSGVFQLSRLIPGFVRRAVRNALAPPGHV